MRTFDGQSKPVWSVAFSPDGNRIVTAGYQEKRNPAFGLAPECGLYTFSCPPILAATKMILWDATTGQQLRADDVSSAVNSVAFSPDGSHILSGGDDTTIELWDAATGGLVRRFEGHSMSVRSVAFSPDGTRVLSGSDDKTIKLWDVATGRLQRTFGG